MSDFQEQDPKEIGDKPPFPEQDQAIPGEESKMTPQPNFGADSYRGSGKLTGKVALITGGDSGIGRAVALAFAREGADVLISYLNEDEDALETVRVVTESGRRAIAVPGDIQELTYEEWDRAFKTNIYAMFYLSKAALRHLPEGGTIINTTSIQSYQPSSSLIHYASTKGAITTFTKALSEIGLKQGVRVNAVAPGPVWTPLITSTMPAEQHTEFGAQSPMGRPGQPAELAPAYVFLASQDSSFISGEIIGVTGGSPLS